MKFKSTLIILIFLFLTPLTFAKSSNDLSIEQVLGKVKRAIGLHNQKADKDEKFYMEGTIDQNGIISPFERYTHGDKFYMSVSGKLPSKMGFDGENYWTTGLSKIPVYQSLNSRNTLICSDQLDSNLWLEKGDKNPFDIKFSKDYNSKQVILDLKQKDGPFKCTITIDKKSWLPVKSKLTERGMLQISEFSDYKRFAGLKTAYKVTMQQPKTNQVIVTKIKKIKKIRKVDETLFLKPNVDLTKNISIDKNIDKTIDFKKTLSGHILVKASIGSDKKHWFLLDSGAEGTLLSKNIADQLKLETFGKTAIIGTSGITTATYHRGTPLTIGQVTLENQLWLIMDLTFLSTLGEKIEGVIGSDLFTRRVIELDFPAQKMTFHNPTTYKLKTSIWQDLQFDGRLPVIPASFEGKTGQFMLDSGAGKMVIFEPKAVKDHDLLKGRPTIPVMMGGAGDKGAHAAKQGMIADLKLGNIELKNQPAVFVDDEKANPLNAPFWTGLVGAALLDKHVIIYNYPESKIAFTKSSVRVKDQLEEFLARSPLPKEEQKQRLNVFRKIESHKGFPMFKDVIIDLCTQLTVEKQDPSIRALITDSIKAQFKSNPQINTMINYSLVNKLDSHQLKELHQSLEEFKTAEDIKKNDLYKVLKEGFSETFNANVQIQQQ